MGRWLTFLLRTRTTTKDTLSLGPRMRNSREARDRELQDTCNVEAQELEKLLMREPPAPWITPRERRLLALYFGLCGEGIHSLSELARLEGRSHARPRQLLQKAVSFVREYFSTVYTFSTEEDVLGHELFSFDLGAKAGVHRNLVMRVRRRMRGVPIGEIEQTPRGALLRSEYITRDVYNAALKMIETAKRGR